MMDQIVVRNADTGHSHIFHHLTSIEALNQLIYQELKVQISDQLLISKNGHVVSSKESLDPSRIFKETFISDHFNTISSKKSFCVYLFNLRNLTKKKSQLPEPKEMKVESFGILNKMHECSVNLREKSYELKPLQQILQEDQLLKLYAYNSQIPEMAQKLHKIISQFVENFYEVKENKDCLNNYIQLYENQRKGLNILIRNIKSRSDDQVQAYKERDNELNEHIKIFTLNLQKMLYHADHQKQIQTQISAIQKKRNSLKSQIDRVRKTVKEMANSNNTSQKQNEKIMKAIDAFMDKKFKELNGYFLDSKGSFIKLIQAIKQKFSKGNTGDEETIILFLNKRSMYEDKFLSYVKKSEQIIVPSEQKFTELYKMYKEQQNNFKMQYQLFDQLLKESHNLVENDMHLDSMLKEMGKKIVGFCHSQSSGPVHQNWVSEPALKNKVSQQSQMSSKSVSIQDISGISQKKDENGVSLNNSKSPNLRGSCGDREQRQLLRRKYFNKKLIALNQELKIIMKEEQTARKLFMGEQNSINSSYQHSILENINVPMFLLNFDETTDRELNSSFGGNKSGLHEKQKVQVDLSFYKSSSGMDRVLLELDLIKNCQVNLKKEGGGIPGKIKNLQTIIEKSADIFHHIYTQKIAQVNKKHENKERHLQFRIGNLERENSEFKQKVLMLSEKKNNEDTEKVWLEEKVNNLMAEIDSLRNNSYKDSMRFKDETQKFEIQKRQLKKAVEDLKKKENVLKADQKQLQMVMKDQIKMVEGLALDLEQSSLRIKELEDLNTEYKIVMGDQQVRIASLQSGANDSKDSNLQQSFYGEHLQKQKKQQDQEEVQVSEANEGDDHKDANNIDQIVRDSESNKKLKKYQDSVYGALEVEIASLKQELEELTAENESLNEEIIKIAMKDVQDQQIQTQNQQPDSANGPNTQNRTLFNPSGNNYAVSLYQQAGVVSIKDEPKEGELRAFIPFSTGVYVAAIAHQNAQIMTSYQTNSLQSQGLSLTSPYILDLNCMSAKGRQLLQQCTLIVMVRVTKILPGMDRWYVEGEIESAMGFEDDDMKMKDYGAFLKSQ